MSSEIQLEFIKSYSEKLSKNQELQTFTQNVQGLLNETNKICPRKETLITKLFNFVSTTDNKNNTQNLVILTADLKIACKTFVSEHKNIFNTCSIYLKTNEETITLLNEKLNSILLEKENTDEESDDYINILFEEQDIRNSILSCKLNTDSLIELKTATKKILHNLHLIESSIIPSVLNTVQTLLINVMNKSAITFSDDISKLNNQSMIKMSEGLVEAQRDVHKILEAAPIEQKTLDTIITNLENIRKEDKRFRADIVGKINKNIDDNQRVLDVLNKRNSVGLIEHENISNK